MMISRDKKYLWYLISSHKDIIVQRSKGEVMLRKELCLMISHASTLLFKISGSNSHNDKTGIITGRQILHHADNHDKMDISLYCYEDNVICCGIFHVHITRLFQERPLCYRG